MKHIFSKAKAFLPMLCIGWGILATSCINENLDACYTLTLRVLNSSGDDITEGDAVLDAGLYIYDENGRYLETVTLNAAQVKSHTPVEINYPATANLRIVAWGNTEGAQQTVAAGSTINDHTLQLATRTGSATVMEHPRDLFFGSDEDIPLRAGVLTRNEVVDISPKVGRLQMRTENLAAGLAAWREQNGLRADEDVTFDFYFDKSFGRVISDGTTASDGLSHNPAAAQSTEGEWDMQEVEDGFENVLPGELQEGAFHINGVVFETEAIDYTTGEPIHTEEGYDTIVVFEWNDLGEFAGLRVDMQVSVRPWERVEDPMEW